MRMKIESYFHIFTPKRNEFVYDYFRILKTNIFFMSTDRRQPIVKRVIKIGQT